MVSPQFQKTLMVNETPWYARESGRWHSSVESALASDNPSRRSLGWCVLATVGGGYKCQTRFAEVTGLSQSAISYYLNGHNKIPFDVAKEINAAVAKCLGSDMIGMFHFFHPFEIGFGLSWAVPGESRWEPWWTSARALAPEELTVEELKTRFPILFP
jgi:hypothetical protein